ncbi:MAG: internal scaffolding protein [Microvirus sp.]|nr:MAG: internal scaffolding protein [Microvirus sp.]
MTTTHILPYLPSLPSPLLPPTMTKPPFLRTPYNYNTDSVSLENGLLCPEPTLTQQSAKDETDINIIMERFGRGQALPDSFRAPTYGDFLGITDYHSAMNAVAQAGEAFDAMPAKLRSRFDNNPANLISFLSDPSNRVEAESLGLVQALPLDKPLEASQAPKPSAAS